MTDYSVKIAVGLVNNPDARIIRESVFVAEQGFEVEFDDTDKTAAHCVIYDGGYPAATGRLYGEKEAHIGRVAVMKAYRGKHLGEMVVKSLEEYAEKVGFEKCVLSAQKRAQGFYEKLGYEAYGEMYYDEYCPHIMMGKKIKTA